MGTFPTHQYSNTEGNTTTMFEDIQDTLGSHGDHGIKPVPTVIPTPTEFQSAGQAGFKALWVVLVIASIVFTIRSWNVPVQRRLYHVITTIITLTAALSYFAMASGQATSYHCISVKDSHKHVPDTHHDVCREVYWARYVDWSITTPLLLLDLCLL